MNELKDKKDKIYNNLVKKEAKYKNVTDGELVRDRVEILKKQKEDKLKKHKEDLPKANEELQDLEEEFEQNSNDLFYLEKLKDMIKTYVDKEITDEDINTKNSLLKNINIGEVTERFQNKNQFSNEDLTFVNKKIKDREASINSLTKDIEELNNTITPLESIITTIEKIDINKIEEAIQSHKSDSVDKLKDDFAKLRELGQQKKFKDKPLNELKTLNSQIQSEIEKLNNHIKSLQAIQTEIKNNLNKISRYNQATGGGLAKKTRKVKKSIKKTLLNLRKSIRNKHKKTVTAKGKSNKKSKYGLPGKAKRKIPQKLHKTLNALGHRAPWNYSSGGAIEVVKKNKNKNYRKKSAYQRQRSLRKIKHL